MLFGKSNLFFSECRSHLGEYAANRGFSRITRITRILRGFLLVWGVLCWNAFARTDIDFITTEEILQTIENHVASLDPFDRSFARYFISTHLYNAGETTETLRAYQRALSKLVNSLSWGREVTKPQPIDSQATIFYIDLRDYEWEIGTNRWTLIEAEYPYNLTFDAPTQTALHEKLTNLRQEMSCDVPFVHVDWFLATASLPPLYHDILDLPLTDSELEARLEVNVVENLRNAAGRRVWRAGFNNSGVSNHNRVVERHRSRYGAYWKSYDFAGSAGSKDIFTHPLNFTHDGGEIIFNLPNGLQAYYLVDAGGNRLDEAPIGIVSNPAVSDPTVRNGLSCIGCHTEGMKTFEDQVRGVAEQSENPPFDKDRVLRLYVEKSEMDALIEEDTDLYRQALEATGDVFGGIEPVQRFHEAFQAPLDASHAAAAAGVETEVFLGRIRENTSLQNLGLLVLESGTVKRDTWTTNFEQVISVLNTPDSDLPPVVQRPERIPGASVQIPDLKLRAAIEEALGKASGDIITVSDMETLKKISAGGSEIETLEGIQWATNLEEVNIWSTSVSDLSPLAGLTKLSWLRFTGSPASDLSPLRGLTNLRTLILYAVGHGLGVDFILDISPLAGLTELHTLWLYWNRIADISPLEGLTKLRSLNLKGCRISDLSPLSALINLNSLDLGGMFHQERVSGKLLTDHDILSDISPLSALINLNSLDLGSNNITDISPLSGLINLRRLDLGSNNITNISPLSGLATLYSLDLQWNNITDISPLAGFARSYHDDFASTLGSLQLQHNKIIDISPLKGLGKKISRFFWYGNPCFPQGGPKIEGPWLWVLVPQGETNSTDIQNGADLLSLASDGVITELKIATNGAIEGSRVGENIWTSHKIAPDFNSGDPSTVVDDGNIGEMLSAIDTLGNLRDVVYGSVTFYSPRQQEINMFAGSTDGHKVWLNGALVSNWKLRGERFDISQDYEEFFPVTLKRGKNVLLVAIYLENWRFSGYFGFESGTDYTLSHPRIGYTVPDSTIHAGDTFTVDISAKEVFDLAGWQFDIAFDPAVLEAVEVNEGDFLKEGSGTTFFQKGTIDNATGKISKLSSARLNEEGVTGTGTLLSVTFSAKADGETQLSLSNFQLGSITGEVINAGPHEFVFTIEGQLATGDVNRDGQVSVLDLILVSRHLGEDASANPLADVNLDGVISILDLIVVAQHLGEIADAAAPSIIAAINKGELTAARVQAWITQAQIEDDGSIAFRQGIANLERLLALFIPEETVLLHNYPNPFNPETWIPYQLAKPTEVTLTIYAANGAIVRTLKLGHQPAGFYDSRSRAAYWDGKNEVGEPVASGIYFYTLSTESTRDSVTAGDFSATRKMLIRK